MSTATTDEPLRLDVCPGCAYQLEGLPPEGLCPECGRWYDQRVVILYGWGAGSRADAGNAKPRHAAALAAAPLVYCTFQLARAWNKDQLVRLALFGLWAAVIVWFLWRRFFTFRGPGLTQVRLSEAGCVQADSTAAADDAEVTPWDKVEITTLERAGENLWHLRLGSRKTWWSPGTAFVDAEVRCSDEQAAAIGRRIEAWRRSGAAGAEQQDNPITSPDDESSDEVACGPGGAVQ